MNWAALFRTPGVIALTLVLPSVAQATQRCPALTEFLHAHLQTLAQGEISEVPLPDLGDLVKNGEEVDRLLEGAQTLRIKGHQVKDFPLPQAILPRVRVMIGRLKKYLESPVLTAADRRFIQKTMDLGKQALAAGEIRYQSFADLNIRLSVAASLVNSNKNFPTTLTALGKHKWMHLAFLRASEKNLDHRHLVIFTHRGLSQETINHGMADGRILTEISEHAKDFDETLAAVSTPADLTDHDLVHYETQITWVSKQMETARLDPRKFMRGILDGIDLEPDMARKKRLHLIFGTVFRELSGHRFMRSGMAEVLMQQKTLAEVFHNNRIPFPTERQLKKDLESFDAFWQRAWGGALQPKPSNP